jgi:hypothetical protein
MEVARLSRKYRRHDELARALFGRGLYVQEHFLKASLVGVIDRAEKWIGPSETEGDLDQVDRRAQQIAKWARRTKQGRKLQRRVRGRSARPEEIAAGVYSTLLHLLKTGLTTSNDGFQDLLDATGLRGLFTETINGLGPFAPEGPDGVETFLRHATLGDLRERIRRSSIEELRESRDLMALMFPFFKHFAILATRWLESPTALGLAMLEDLEVDELSIGTSAAIGLAVLPYTRTPGAKTLLEGIRLHAAYYEALAGLALRLPKEVVPAMRQGDPKALAGLPEGQRIEIQEAAHAVAALASGLAWPGAEPSNDTAEVPAS